MRLGSAEEGNDMRPGIGWYDDGMPGYRGLVSIYPCDIGGGGGGGGGTIEGRGP